MAQWRVQTGAGWSRRLAWMSLDDDAARAALSAVPSDARHRWSDVLDAVMAEARMPRPAPSPLCDDNVPLELPTGADALPFEELLWPALRVARQRLRRRLAPLRAQCHGDLSPLIVPAAYQAAERSLAERLVHIGQRTIGQSFAATRPLAFNLLGVLPDGDAPQPRDHYRRFVAALLAAGLAPLFRQYPVLGRLFATAIEDWESEFAEFMQRLCADHAALAAEIADDQELGPAVALEQDLSDPHRGGRTVRIVSFARGQRVAYKPRSVRPEMGLDALLAWSNASGLSLALKRIRHLDRGGYGWALDCVRAEPCADAAAGERFYRRAGMLLAFAYLLDANDLHSENLIAAGEHPVIVDAETLMHPQLSSATDAAEDGPLVANSVLRTGLLPRWSFAGETQAAYDISGLGHYAGQHAPQPALRWQAINSDYMTLWPQAATLPTAANVPRLGETCLQAGDRIEAICAGFAEAYRLFLTQHSRLLGPQSPLLLLRIQPVRILFRPTQVYAALLEQALSPPALTDGRQRSIILDAASHIFLDRGSPPPTWALLAVELRALERMDIPYFETRADSRAIKADGVVVIPQAFAQSGYERIRTRLARLDEADLAYQTMLIRGSFAAQQARPPHGLPTPQAIERSDATPLSPQRLMAEAAAIAARIVGNAMSDGQGGVTWFGLRYSERAQCYQFEPVGLDLYEGRCGIALFLAAADFAHGRDTHRDIIARALAPLLQRLCRPDLATPGIGGGTGLGGAIYALTRIAGFTGEAHFADEAAIAARAITADAIANDTQLDVIGGAAGAILGLLALHATTHDHTALDRARLCGEHLLARQTAHAGGKAWRTFAAEPLTGFSHGAAGIALALQRLASATGDKRFLDAAESAIAYEQSRYDSAAGNWPDFRRGADAYAMSWCHGAPGIGLARLGGLESHAPAGMAQKIEQGIKQDIEYALAAVLSAPVHGVDHLCCGRLGVAETLLTASIVLDRPELGEMAQRHAAKAVAQAGPDGNYRLIANAADSPQSPGLFQGLSGIGYQLLRFAAPDRFPCLLLWQ